jgi:hypothetical protein
MTPPAVVVSCGALGLAFAWQARDAAKRIGAEISDATAKALVELRRKIAATPSLQRHLVEPMAKAAPIAPPVSPRVDSDLREIAAEADRLEQEAAALRAKVAELEKRR